MKLELKKKLNEMLGRHDGPRFIALFEGLGIEDDDIEYSAPWITIPADKVTNKVEFMENLSQLSVVDRAFSLCIVHDKLQIDTYATRTPITHGFKKLLESSDSAEEQQYFNLNRLEEYSYLLTSLLFPFPLMQLMMRSFKPSTDIEKLTPEEKSLNQATLLIFMLSVHQKSQQNTSQKSNFNPEFFKQNYEGFIEKYRHVDPIIQEKYAEYLGNSSLPQ